jgi:hypothetical protein
MISLILTCLLPLANGADIGISAQVQVAPGIAVNLHSDSYYTQRDHDRQANLARIQADRESEQRHRDDYDRQKVRDPGSIYVWRDTREEHTKESQRLQNQQAAHEQDRAAQEQRIHADEDQDRTEHQR